MSILKYMGDFITLIPLSTLSSEFAYSGCGLPILLMAENNMSIYTTNIIPVTLHPLNTQCCAKLTCSAVIVCDHGIRLIKCGNIY